MTTQPYPITQTPGPFRITHVGSFETLYASYNEYKDSNRASVLAKLKLPAAQVFFVHTMFQKYPTVLIGDGAESSTYCVCPFKGRIQAEAEGFNVDLPSPNRLANEGHYVPVQVFLTALTEAMNRIPNLYVLQEAVSSYFEVSSNLLNAKYIFDTRFEAETQTFKYRVFGNVNPINGLVITNYVNTSGETIYRSWSSGTYDQTEIYKGSSMQDCLKETATFLGRTVWARAEADRRKAEYAQMMQNPNAAAKIH